MSDTILQAGQKAPTFKLSASNGQTIDLAGFRGKSPVVLYFYPKADTPGCTKEACGFRDTIDQFKKAKVAILGISPDPVEDVQAFSDKFTLNFPLLADSDHKVAESYGVWQEKNMMGRKYMGVVRTTFIIDKDGKIVHVFEKVKPEGHEQEVYNWLASNLL
ncbi:MAG: thioredoxin-dependent thiol peroxidase [Phycisphaerales bacterium]|nr:thioredoxin-dependent thiol peroxidase [Phycisphaerales bacterium]